MSHVTFAPVARFCPLGARYRERYMRQYSAGLFNRSFRVGPLYSLVRCSNMSSNLPTVSLVAVPSARAISSSEY